MYFFVSECSEQTDLDVLTARMFLDRCHHTGNVLRSSKQYNLQITHARILQAGVLARKLVLHNMMTSLKIL